MNQTQEVAEQATGICENPYGLGKLYANRDCELTMQEAQDRIFDGKQVEIPNAGAGSYRKVFCDLFLYQKIEVIDWTSSAGDWCFGVLDDGIWRVAFQENRYPYHGFRYSVSQYLIASTFEELCEHSN